MTAYLSFEWLKFSKRWMPRIILLLLLALLVFGFWGQGTRVEDQVNLAMPRAWLAALVFSGFFAPFFWPVLGGSWAGNEYGWGTIRTILTRRPYRIEQCISQLIVLLTGLVIAMIALLIVGSIAGGVVGALTGNGAFISGVLSGSFIGTVVKTLLSAWYVSAFYLILAYAAATVFNSAAVGIGIGIGSSLAELVLERILRDLGGNWVQLVNHFPISYTTSLTQQIASPGFVSGTNMATVDPGTPGVTESVVALAIYIAVFLAITFAAVRSRDVTA